MAAIARNKFGKFIAKAIPDSLKLMHLLGSDIFANGARWCAFGSGALEKGATDSIREWQKHELNKSGVGCWFSPDHHS